MLTDLFVRVFVCDLHSSCDRYFMHELDREDEARPRVEELLARGLREAGFLELSRQTRG